MDIDGLVIFVMGVTCSISIMGRLAPGKEHMQSLVRPALQALFVS
ncbi:hypothetical protein [Endozoicomonas montiporae]|nr:hypothetical protein [Endozoicomonas montiporae]